MCMEVMGNGDPEAENAHTLWTLGLASAPWWSLVTDFHLLSTCSVPVLTSAHGTEHVGDEKNVCPHRLAYFNSSKSVIQQIFLSTCYWWHYTRHTASWKIICVLSTHPSTPTFMAYIMPLGSEPQNRVIKIFHCFFFPFNNFPFIKV